MPFSLFKKQSQFTPLLLLIAIWISYLILLLILQLAKTDIGLRMPLYAEDRYWLWHLLRPSIANISSSISFWQVEQRNPLSPLWYVPVKSLILGNPEYVFPILRHSVDLLSAVSIFLLIDTLGRGSQRFFAFSCALLTLFWNTNGINVSWNLIAATALHVLSLWTYCLYLDSSRTKGRLFAVSLALYFFAIGTYLLVAASFIAVGLFAIFRPTPRPITVRAWIKRIATSILDMSFYLGCLGLFFVLWQLMSGYPALSSLNPALIRLQFLSSLNFTFIKPLTDGPFISSISTLF